jgi:hypothetical protein
MNLEQVECDAFADEDLLLAHIVAGQVGSAIYRCQLVDELEGAFLTTLGVLADAVGAMIIATCDAYHAMTSDRSYRKAMPKDAAIGELRAGAGTQFNPEAVSALVAELG